MHGRGAVMSGGVGRRFETTIAWAVVGHAALTCDAKVTVTRNQEVSRFEVAMYNVMIVEVGDPSQQLIHKIPVVRIRKRLRRLMSRVRSARGAGAGE